MTPLPPVGRVRRVALSAVLCAGLAVALTACGEDPDAGTNGIGKLSAEEIENKARAAADAAASVRLSGTLVSKGGTYKLNMRLKHDGGTGSLTSKENAFELLRIDDALFLKADAGFWSHVDGGGEEPSKSDMEAAEKLADKYVKVPKGDPSYKQFRGFTDMDVLLDGLLGMQGELSKGDRTQVGGVRTIKVTAGEGGRGGVLDVSLEGKPFPLQFARAGGAGVLTLADWDKDFPLAEPAKGETVDYGGQLPKTSGSGSGG